MAEERRVSYKTQFNEIGPKYWRVLVTEKPGIYSKNRSIGVVAMDAEQAIGYAQKKYHGCRVVSVNHIGPVDLWPEQ